MPEAPEDWQTAGFGLYIHWPFCKAKCPYCDFNSHVVAQIDQARWARAYQAEIARVAAETKGRVLRSVFFGGGTPSLMEPFVVEAVLDAVRAAWPLANDCEITLEANPTSVEAGRFAAYRDAGVNRISMGVQALNDADLRALGRTHSVAEAMAAFDVARSLFGRVSFDLIYARQGQTATIWEAELRQALEMAVDHVSLYQLTIEDGTAFGDRFARGKLRGLPDEDRAADMWDVTQAATEAAGFAAYEVSNHARNGAESRHNLIYWASGDWAGIGPGAHGRITLDGVRSATETASGPMDWLLAVERHGSGEGARNVLSLPERLTEMLMMGLRLNGGVAMDRIVALGAEKLQNNINVLVEMGMVDQSDGRLRATAIGRPVLNAVLARLLQD